MAATSPSKTGSDVSTAGGLTPRGKVVMIDRSPVAEVEVATVPRLRANAQPDGQIEIDDLYPAREAGSPELDRALKLLSAASNHMREAGTLLREGDQIGADLATQRLYGILAELFNCRRLGDGFGVLINALQCCFENLNGAPLSAKQVDAVSRVLAIIRGEPYVAFAVAVERLDILEDSGLSVDPQGFEYIADWLDGERSS